MTDRFTHGYALLIGVGKTKSPGWSLPVTVKDARALKAVFTDGNHCAYPDSSDHIRLLHDEGAIRDAILDGLDWLKEKAAADREATIVFYYSGHGMFDLAEQAYYLLQHDFDRQSVPETALSAQTLTEKLREIKAKRLWVIIDSCHGEGMASAKDDLPADFLPTALPQEVVEALKQGEGRAVFTSSRGSQKSWVRPDRTLSIYTYHLIEALKGAANQPGDRQVILSNVITHLSKKVPESARTLCQAEQTPFFDMATEDFPVALLGRGKNADEHDIERDELIETSDLSIFFGRDAELKKLIEEVDDPDKYLSELIDMSEGNLLAFEVVVNIMAIIIRELFDGSKEVFIKQKDLVINKIIAEHFKQDPLRDLQIDIMDIMSCFAVTSQPLSLQELANNILFFEQLSSAELLGVMEELGKRSLIEEINDSGVKRFGYHEEFAKKVIAQLLAKYLNKIGQKKLYYEGEFNGAKDYLVMSISYNPELAVAHYNLGCTYEKLYDMSAARASYKKAMQYDNRAAHAAINNLARLEILAGNFAVAIEIIEPILAVVNDTIVKASLHKNLGWAYLEQNRYNEAKQHLQESLKLDSSYIPAHCLLAKVQLALVEYEDALLSCKKCLELEECLEPQAGVSWKLPEVDIWMLEVRRTLNAKHT